MQNLLDLECSVRRVVRDGVANNQLQGTDVRGHRSERLCRSFEDMIVKLAKALERSI